ncbi:MAG: type II toxin-antitoxin system VapC family toxin [Muribaculaceae bacterium]|nr:type II toxin-antitoxin system VapC family toxin [Muribaculaceae bacterium]
MEIIVNDTNIFIDLHSIGLLEALCELPYDVRTVDFVIAEITDPEQSEALSALATERKIRIESFDAEELGEIITEHSSVPGNISIPDCSVCYYARKHTATLLTGDRQLRRYAEASKVSVRGVLFLFDELVANNIIPSHQAAAKLLELVAINVRLPKAEIEKRINNWSKSQ